MKEKTLVTRQKRLELQCAEQNETIHNLSVNLSQLSASSSMHDLSSTSNRCSTPLRNARSMYQVDSDDTFDDDYNPDDSESRPLSPPTNVSAVAPMRRQPASTSGYDDSLSDSLLKREHKMHNSTSSYGPSSSYNVNNTTNNFNTYESRHNRSEGDLIGVVRPNNSRTMVDVEIDNLQDPSNGKEEKEKKKKKKLGRLFGLCTGKSGQAKATQGSIYHKNSPGPRIKITNTAAYENDVF